MDTNLQRSTIPKEDTNIDFCNGDITILGWESKNYKEKLRCLKELRFDKSDLKMIGVNVIYIILLNIVLAGISFGIMHLLNTNTVTNTIIP